MSETLSDNATGGAAATRRLDVLLAHYGESHRNPANEAIHMVAIPVIMLSLIGLLHAAHPWVAYAFVVASLVYYVRLGSKRFLLAMGAVTALLLALVHAMGAQALPICATLFVLAWLGQFVGHKLEGKKPSFFEDIQYLWVGPLFVLSRVFIRLGWRW